MNNKSFKVAYASEVRNGVSTRTGNDYRLQEVVLVATDEPQQNADGSQHYPTSIATTAFNLDTALKVGDTLACDVKLSAGRGASGKWYTRVEISNINLDTVYNYEESV